MERKSQLREALGEVKKNIEEVAGEARQTVDELKETVRTTIPRPFRRRIKKRVDDVITGRRKKHLG